MGCNKEKLRGIFPAMVTPFTQDGGDIDWASFESLLERLIAAKVNGVVVCGSTGEAATLGDKEYVAILQRAAQIVGGRCLCIGGINASATNRAVEFARLNKECGMDAALLVVPPYNKPPQGGIIEHYRAVHKAVTLPLIAYNVPSRTGVNMLPETVARLAEEKLIIGLKESSGNIDQFLEVCSLVGDSISVLTGECAQVHASYACGGNGAISASSNLVPEKFVALVAAWAKKDLNGALVLQQEIAAVAKLMFLESNPIPVKSALALKGWIAHPTVRLPLVPARSETLERIRRIL